MRIFMTRHSFHLTVIAFGLLVLGAGQPHGQPDLRGEITVERLYDSFPVFRTAADAYRPDPEAVKAISRINRNTRLVVFLGTWCLDSRSEIPALLKTLSMARNPLLQLDMYAVDRTMDDGIGMADRLELQSVPTVIVFRNGHEVGRMRGLARDSMETDLIDVIHRAP